MARVVAVAADLMLGSKVEATLSAAGHTVELATSFPDATGLESADLLVVDLDRASPDAAVGLGPPTLGFYSHTDVETRERAEAAGFDLVVPRSRMAREMPELAKRLLAGGA